MVCAVDALAAEAGVATLRRGGNAVDAAIATNAVLAVTTQHMCGLGGDLFALVSRPGEVVPRALNASGRAATSASADADRLRAAGQARIPMSGDLAAVTVPGCADGWSMLSAELGRLPLATALAPAIDLARNGFPATVTLSRAAAAVAKLPGGQDFRAATHPGALVRRPGVARALEALASGGRNAFYAGEFGAGLLALRTPAGGQHFTADDLVRAHAEWVQPLQVDAWGARLWTVPPNSQGYLALAGAAIAAGLPLPADPDEALWAHLTVEAARVAAYDRVAVLHDGADGVALLAGERLAARRALVMADRAVALPREHYAGGGTVYLCAVDADRMGVSLIQSNAVGFGARIAEPTTGIFLQNRGIGFSLQPGSPAELAPGRRPPHTLSPALVTDVAGRLDTVLGSMGGDAQPQIVLQLLARLLQAGEDVGDAIAAPRWALSAAAGRDGFDTWDAGGSVQVHLEAEATAEWEDGLASRGHDVVRHPPLGYNVGHAHAIRVDGDVLAGASDPRSLAGAAIGY